MTRGNYSSPNVSTDTRYHAGFIQDSWTFGRITLKPGLRFEQQGMNGIQSRYSFAHNWAPRIGVIVDPFNDRKTKIDMSWGRFFEKIPLDMAIRALSFETGLTGAWFADPGPGNQPNLSPSSYVPGGTIAFQGDRSLLEMSPREPARSSRTRSPLAPSMNSGTTSPSPAGSFIGTSAASSKTCRVSTLPRL